MIRTVRPAGAVRGELRVPGDKSISHRAAIFNAIAEGSAKITGFLPGADCLSTLACLRALGVAIDQAPSGDGRAMSLVVHGSPRLAEPADVLDAGNSGTTMRLLSGLLSGQPLFAVLDGDASLRSRPMARVAVPLREMGAHIDGRDGGRLAPLAIRGGGLHGINYDLPVASAQVKSALLLAGLKAEGETRLREPARSRDHTERMLTAMGAPVMTDGAKVTVEGPSSLRALDVDVPGDLSSAAFWLVAAAIHPRGEVTVRGVGVNPTRAGLLEVLTEMNADGLVEDPRECAGEPVADVTLRGAQLRSVEIGGEIVPRLIDEVPIIAVAAACASGTTVVRDAAELRVKETDRVSTLAAELRKFGVVVEEHADGFAIVGGHPLHGAQVDSHGDHRLAMALAIAALVAEGETEIHGAEAVDVSYPGFWDDLAKLVV